MALEGCEADWNQEALQALQAYLQIAPFSQTSMHDQLMFEDFTQEEILYALENCNVVWEEQALLRAQQMLEEGTAAEDLKELLLWEGFTEEQAQYAITKA